MKYLKFIFPLFTILLLLMNCQSNSSKTDSDRPISKISEDETFITKSFAPKASQIDKLKLIVDSASTSKKNNRSIVITNKDSINDFLYLSQLFDVNKVDSIEIYGVLPTYKMMRRRLPMNSLAILYSSDIKFWSNSLDSLSLKTNRTFRLIEQIFKPGGIAFNINKNLCLYSINACGPGFIEVQRIDSLIKNKVFNGEAYFRLQSGCGMGKMIVKEN